MVRVTQSAAGFSLLRRRLADLPRAAQTEAAMVLREVASEAADAVRADLPPEIEAVVTVDPDPAGAAVTVEAAGMQTLEYGSLARPPRPVLRPIGLAAGARALGLLSAALRKSFEGGRP